MQERNKNEKICDENLLKCILKEINENSKVDSFKYFIYIVHLIELNIRRQMKCKQRHVKSR